MIYLAFLIALVYVLFLYRITKPELSRIQKFFLASLRFISVSLVLMFLLIPTFKYFTYTDVKPKGIVLIDNSISMNNQLEGQTKNEIIAEFYNTTKTDLDKSFDLETYYFSSNLGGDSLTTNLTKTLKTLNSNSNIAGSEIFLLSDGYFIDDNLEKIKNFATKINTFSLDNESNTQKPTILGVRTNRNSYADVQIPFEIKTRNYNFSGMKLELIENNKTLVSENLKSSESLITSNLFYKFKDLGLHQIEVVLSDGNEVIDTKKTVINIEDNKSKILFLTDSPDWDLKSFKEVVSSDNRFEYKTLVANNNKLYFKKDAVDLDEYLKDRKLMVIFNNDNLRLKASALRSIKKKVNQGMSLLIIGNNVTGLTEISPTNNSNISKVYEGNIVKGSMSSMYSTFDSYFSNNQDLSPVKYKYVTLKNSSLELMKIDNMEMSPAIAFMRLGKAKILHMNIKDMWRWGSRNDYDQYKDFILNIVSWLNSDFGENFILNSDKDGYYYGEDVNITASIIDEKGDYISNRNLEIKIQNNDSKELVSTDYLMWNSSDYSYLISDLASGNYTVSVEDKDTKEKRETTFIVFDYNNESKQVDFNNIMLREISKITDGKNINIKNREEAKTSFIRETKELSNVNEILVLYNKWALLLFITTFVVELFYRKRWGLL